MGAKAAQGISVFFHIPVGNVFMMQDKYGLSPDDWKAMGFAFKGYRMSLGASGEYVAASSEVAEKRVYAFEECGIALSKQELTIMCGVLKGATLNDVFHGYAEHFYAKKAPTVSDGRETLSDEGHHIGVLFDRADEKDRLLTHTVLDKYEDAEKIVFISSKSKNPGGMVEVDIYDEPAAAGLGNYLDAPQVQRHQFPSFMVPKGTSFGIRISGNSMMPMVEDGATVFVKHTPFVESGKTGIFILNGKSYCKQLVVDHKKQEVRLHSFNPDYDDIVVTPEDTLITIGQVL